MPGSPSGRLGAIVDMITPMPRARRRMTAHEVPGRSGLLHIEERGFDAVTRNLSLSVRSKTAMEAVNEWCVSSGGLVVTDEPGYFHKAYQGAAFDWDRKSQRLYEATIPFEVIPYRYLVSGKDSADFTEPVTVFNAQAVESEPVFMLYATGDVALHVGNYVVNLTGLSGVTTIDSEMQMILENGASISYKMRGDFPLFLPGKNEINWFGNVDRITIIPRWRRL